MIGGKVLLTAPCMLLMALSACVQTEFFDDFEDGTVDPVYRFVVGDASSVFEGGPCEDWGNCLQRIDNAYLFLPGIPGTPNWITTPITAGVVIKLDVLRVGVQSTVELGVADSMQNPRDYFALRVEIDPATQESRFTCYDEDTRVPLEDSLSFPVNLSFRVDETGVAYGNFSEGTSEIECPLHSAVSSPTLAPAIVMWSYGGEGVAWVDNFHVELQ